jgi:hypothetical protein
LEPDDGWEVKQVAGKPGLPQGGMAMMDSWTSRLSAAALLTALGAPAVLADAAALDKFAGAKEAIMSYYASNAHEGGGNCRAGQMTDISDARVVSESGNQAVVAVDYSFTASPLSGTTGTCSGPTTRQFTLSKGGSGWTVTGMSGEAP